jgi:uncharacterized membrane protein YeiH
MLQKVSVSASASMKQPWLRTCSAAVCARYQSTSSMNNMDPPSSGASTTISSTTIESPVPPREGLPPYPGITTSTGFLRSVDYMGTIVFSMSGTLTAAASQCDLLGCVVVGTITAVGGGTLRDVIVLNKQPFWTTEWEYLWLAAGAALATFFLWEHVPEESEERPFGLKSASGGEGEIMFWGDAFGIGGFSVIGVMNGLRAGCPMIVCAMCGMMTATFGGVVRDTVLNRPVRILHPYSDTYAPIAVSSAVLYLGLKALMPPAAALGPRIFACLAYGTGMRYGAREYGWRMPYWSNTGPNAAAATAAGACGATNQVVTYTNRDPRTTTTAAAPGGSL